MATMALSDLSPTPGNLAEVFRTRFGDPRATGPLPRLWHRLGYFVPDIHYEALVANLVQPGSSWLDVGCGRGIFPTNPRLAETLAGRCRVVAGVDPDENVDENPLLHVRA